MRLLLLLFLLAVSAVVFGATACAQTTTSGSALALKSTGSGSGTWTIDRNGYVGTYINIASPGNVTVRVNASGTASGGVNPFMNIVLADTKAGFDVAPGMNPYEHTFNLPAGTYFLRTEFNNDIEATTRQLNVQDITVSGASVSNSSTNANALAAANTYINNFRKGNVKIGLSGLAPGTNVTVSLKRHAFDFGTAVPGFSNTDVNNYLGSGGTTKQTNYQSRLTANFNAIVPENAGKWSSNAGSSSTFDMSSVDAILSFAETKNLRTRMHNLIWGSQQPGWVNTLLSQAAGGDVNAINTLRNEITERIAYYVADRAQNYGDIDVYNESVHTPQYWNIYHADGIAGIYNEVAAALGASDNNTRMFTNEYNVLQDTGDYFANWYLQHIESILAEGGTVGGIGIQSYENNAIGTTQNAHYPARKMQSLQNLSVLGLPITLTEFAVKSPTSQTNAATMLDETVHLVFGTPDATGFYQWGFHQESGIGATTLFHPAAALYTVNTSNFNSWTTTTPGQRWQDLMSVDADADPNDDWNTQIPAVAVAADGTINFNGFWGDYELTINGQTYLVTLSKGTNLYSMVVAPGDFNGDHVVDAADYVIWRSTVGSTNDLRADGDGNKVIDLTDLNVWRSNFGMNYGSGAGLSVSVPEPSAVMMLFLGAAVVQGASRRQRR